jgi:hypothetical protein
MGVIMDSTEKERAAFDAQVKADIESCLNYDKAASQAEILKWRKNLESQQNIKSERLICPTCHCETRMLLPQYNGCDNCYGLTAENDCSE